MEVAITGASGLIGSALALELNSRGHRPIALVRRPTRNADEISWDIPAQQVDTAALEGIGAVVHLAGAGIGDKRWNDRYRAVLRDSRVAGTSLLAGALAGLDRPPAVFLSGSAIGLYGDRPGEVLDEQSSPGESFLSGLVAGWEAAAAPAAAAGIPTTWLRTGIVQSRQGGALAKMLPLFRFGLGGVLGDGRQMMSWISLADVVGAIISLIEQPAAGPVNLTAPQPVDNRRFTKALGAALGRPTVLRVPRFVPRLILGRQMADALLFESQDVRPAVLIERRYVFAHPDIDTCFEAALSSRS